MAGIGLVADGILYIRVFVRVYSTLCCAREQGETVSASVSLSHHCVPR